MRKEDKRGELLETLCLRRSQVQVVQLYLVEDPGQFESPQDASRFVKLVGQTKRFLSRGGCPCRQGDCDGRVARHCDAATQ